MKIGLVVQARNGSERFPRKMIQTMHGRRAIDWVIDRCEGIHAHPRILATSVKSEDDCLVDAAHQHAWDFVRGDAEDVLSRFSTAVRNHGLEGVVRITGDCILTDYRLVNLAIERFLKEEADYLTWDGIMDGFDVEVVRAEVLLESEGKARLPSDREHVTRWIQRKKGIRAVRLPHSSGDHSKIHLSLDCEADLRVIGRILSHFHSMDFQYEDVVSLVEQKPELIAETCHIPPNEGLDRSHKNDRDFIRRLKAKPLVLEKSLSHHEEAGRVIPNASQTFSKSAMQFSLGAVPLYVQEGMGAKIVDIDGNTLIDYTMGLGASVLGYAFEPVVRDCINQMSRGSIFSLPHTLELELAKTLTTIIPSAEMVRFGKNGSDVTSAAIRLARAATGREMVACCGYHGWHDWYIGTTTRSGGVPGSVQDLSLTFQYNDIGSLEKLFHAYPGKIAAVIMEPVGLDEPKDDFLTEVRDVAHREGALLVFDEVVSGFRYAMGGAQSLHKVVPDLSCFGKSIANGMPLSALVGRMDLMKRFEEVFFSLTFGGEAVSLAAGKSTLSYMMHHDVIDWIWRQGRKLQDGIASLIQDHELEGMVAIRGNPVRFVLEFCGIDELQEKTLFQQECARRGILFSGAHHVSLPHDDKIIQSTLEVYDQVLSILKLSIESGTVSEMLDGAVLTPIFRPL